MRYELKYIINPVQYQLLRDRLKWVMKPDPHAGEEGEYFIRSIYFDSEGMDALLDKQNGIHHRKKYRIRFYNQNADQCSLECKEKIGTRIQKTSLPLTCEEAEKLLFGANHAAERLLQRQHDMEVLMRNQGMKPVVTVDYLREAYVLPLSDLRITFDKQIAGGPVEECLIRERYLPNILGENMVLEVKYNMFLPEHISSMIASVRPTQTAMSKYTMCMEKLLEWRGL